MKYVALLRGVNVGKARWIDMKELRYLFESVGCINVSTYINSGNVVFECNDDKVVIGNKIGAGLLKKFGSEIPVLVKTHEEMMMIANAIPKEWKNDASQRTDVAFLFPGIDTMETMNGLPVKKEFMDIRCLDGAICWNIARENINRSHLNNIISHRLYQVMTVRNVNTVRYLSGLSR
jgi:uncharacterized protein (DUF1697 family)